MSTESPAGDRWHAGMTGGDRLPATTSEQRFASPVSTVQHPRRQYDRLRERHCADAMMLAPALIERLSWSAERLAVHRRARLRALLRTATEHSHWHRRRLSGIRVETFEESDMDRLPVMTKDDLMEHFDEILTDARLSLELVESHLASLTDGAYLLDCYHAVASGGSSGRRGVFVFGWDAWAIRWLSNVRLVLREYAGHDSPVQVAMVASGDVTHGTSALSRTFSHPMRPVLRLPVTLPLGEIVAGLTAAQPAVLTGYPSSLLPLAHETLAGRLRIRPHCVISTSEPLFPAVRSVLEDAWCVPVTNCWSASEAGGIAVSCGRGPGMHLSEDLVIVEPVDEEGRAVPTGVQSAKVYLTNLYNPTLPLIRYEITDRVTTLGGVCPCGSGHRRIEDVEGRTDDVFLYGNLMVNPMAFETPLTRQRSVLDYQVRQTRRGAVIAVRSLGPVDVPLLQSEISGNLVRLGLGEPEVVVTVVDELDRVRTGKLRRFIPLPDRDDVVHHLPDHD